MLIKTAHLQTLLPEQAALTNLDSASTGSSYHRAESAWLLLALLWRLRRGRHLRLYTRR